MGWMDLRPVWSQAHACGSVAGMSTFCVAAMSWTAARHRLLQQTMPGEWFVNPN